MTEEGAAAKLAVGYRLQSDVFLEANGLANGVVFQRAQLAFGHRAFTDLVPRLDQCARAQQAADVIGMKRRGIAHSFSRMRRSRARLDLIETAAGPLESWWLCEAQCVASGLHCRLGRKCSYFAATSFQSSASANGGFLVSMFGHALEKAD